MLKEHPEASPYIDDIIIGSTGNTLEQALQHNYHAVRLGLKTFETHKLIKDPDKSDFFQTKYNSVDTF